MWHSTFSETQNLYSPSIEGVFAAIKYYACKLGTKQCTFVLFLHKVINVFLYRSLFHSISQLNCRTRGIELHPSMFDHAVFHVLAELWSQITWRIKCPYIYTFCYFLLWNISYPLLKKPIFLTWIFSCPPAAVLHSSAFPRVSDFVSNVAWHMMNDLVSGLWTMRVLTCIMSSRVVCQAAGEGEAGVRSAEWAGRDERLPGASQEKEQCRFPAVLSWKCMTKSTSVSTLPHIQPHPFFARLQNIL